MQEFWTVARQKIKDSNNSWQTAKLFRQQATHCEDEAGKHLVSALAILQEGAILLGKNLKESNPLTKDGMIVGIELVFIEGGLEKKERYYDESGNLEKKDAFYLSAARQLSQKIEKES